MIVLGKPKNPDNFIMVSERISLKLQEYGFFPKFRDNSKRQLYFEHNDKIISILQFMKGEQNFE